MNHAFKALVMLALGAGLATAAQAQGTNTQNGTAGATTPNSAPTAAMPSTPPATAPTAAAPSATAPSPRPARMARSATKPTLSRNEVREAQEQLKSEGLYRGRIDGVMGHRTHLALSRFQQRNGLHRTASLDPMTLNRLLGSRTTGVGSSTPTQPMMAPNSPAKTGAVGNNAMSPSTHKGY